MKAKSLRCSVVATTVIVLAGIGAVASTARSADAEAPAQRTRTAGPRAADTAITQKVTSAITADMEIEAPRISVSTDNGVVQLGGFANSEQEADRAAKLAREVPGVKEVINGIRSK